MFQTAQYLLYENRKYASPRMKLMRMEEAGEIIRLRRGIYSTDSSVSPYAAASVIYGPSYISFETALAFHGLIPERVECILSATTGKNKKKIYTNRLGTFAYEDVPAGIFPYAIEYMTEGESHYMMAGPEKALCDLLSKRPPLGSKKEIADYITEGLRVEPQDFRALDHHLILTLAEGYHSTNMKYLSKLSKELLHL